MCSRQTGCYLVSFNHFKGQLVNVLETISEESNQYLKLFIGLCILLFMSFLVIFLKDKSCLYGPNIK